MSEFQINIKKYPIYFNSPNPNLKFSDKVLYQSLFVLDTYINNFDDYLLELADNSSESFILYNEEFGDIFQRYLDNIIGTFIVDICKPYIAKYPENKFHQVIEMQDEDLLELFDEPILQDEEIAMRILDLIPEFYSITEGIRSLTREPNMHLLTQDIPNEFFSMFTTIEISPFAYLKSSVQVFARVKSIEERIDKKKRN